MKRFIRGLLALTALSHAAFALAAAHALGGGVLGALGALAAVAAASLLLLPRLRLLLDDRPIGPLRRALERLYFVHWGACLLSTALLVLLSPAALLGAIGLGALAAGAYGASLAVATYAVFVRTRLPRLRCLDVPIADLDPAYDGYRVAQLSDLHVGSLFPAEAVLRFVEVANRAAPDLIVATGDYLTSGSRFHPDVARVLCALRAPDGVFAIWGNHDNYDGREPLRSLLLAGGVRLLENTSARLERAGASLTLVGVDDLFSRRADVAASFRDVEPGATVIGLVHDPKQFTALAERGAALVLTGHTHWGQVGLPLLPERVNLARRFFAFSAGVYQRGRATLYVHPGIGATGPPLRFGVAPEVTVLTLRRAAPQAE